MVAKRISLEEYSSRLTAECNKVYDLINVAKAKGFDPKTEIEIPQAIDLAERTQKLLKFFGNVILLLKSGNLLFLTTVTVS